MTQFALRYDQEIVHDGSWTCLADVIGSFHAAYTDERRRVTGVLLQRETEDDEWKEVL